MRDTRKTVAFCFFAFVLLTAPAYADPIDVADTSGFGSVVLGPTTTTFNFGSGVTADVQSTVFLNSGVYTYVYLIDNSTGASPVNVFSIAGSFDSSLDWGLVTGGTTSGVGLDSPDATTFGAPAPFCGSNGFLGCAPSGITFFFSDGSGTIGGLHSGEGITIYAQSNFGPGPNTQPAILIDTDHALGSVSAPVPEPGTMALFGSGLIGLAFAIRRRLLS